MVLALAGLLIAAVPACSERVEDSRREPDRTPQVTVVSGSTPAAGETPAATLPGIALILEDVAEVRQLAPPPTLKAELIARSALPALLDRLLTQDDMRIFAETTTFYRLLGYMRNDQDYLSIYRSFGANAILGLYSPLDDQLWVVHGDGETLDFEDLPLQEAETLAHELVHALQDYHFKLDRVYETVKDNLDRGLAWTAVVEGDAVVHEQAYSKKFLASLRAGRLFLLADQEQIPDVPPAIARELFFPYTTAPRWVEGVLNKQGVKTIDRLLQEPPAGTAYVLHPNLLEDGWQPDNVTLPDLAAGLGAGWRRESGGQFGEFHLRNYLQQRLAQGAASTAAAGWAGDRYTVYVNGNQSVAIFRVAFSDAGEARAFAGAHQDLLRSARSTSTRGEVQLAEMSDGDVTATLTPSGREVIFAIGTSGEVAARALELLVRG